MNFRLADQNTAEVILIVGAGAIGRGFLAPYFTQKGYAVRFADKDPNLLRLLAERDGFCYQTAITTPDGYEMQRVPYLGCSAMDDLSDGLRDVSYIFFCVGIKQLAQAAASVQAAGIDARRLKAVYSVENDPQSRDILGPYFPDPVQINFGVPDVITSSMAPPGLLETDPLCVMSEQGALFIEGGFLKSHGPAYDDAYVTTHWTCKKYLHNTPHAALAYLGAEKGYEFIHEACLDVEIEALILRLMAKIKTLLEVTYHINSEFMSDYMDKEIRRFKNVNMYDPITRVGRNPDIKLSPGERIIHIADMFVSNGMALDDIARVIDAAFNYSRCADFNQMRRQTDRAEFLRKISGISPQSALGRLILEQA